MASSGIDREVLLGSLRNLLLAEQFGLEVGTDMERELERTPAGEAVSARRAELTRGPVEAAAAVALACPCVPLIAGAVAIAWGLWAPWAS